MEMVHRRRFHKFFRGSRWYSHTRIYFHFGHKFHHFRKDQDHMGQILSRFLLTSCPCKYIWNSLRWLFDMIRKIHTLGRNLALWYRYPILGNNVPKKYRSLSRTNFLIGDNNQMFHREEYLRYTENVNNLKLALINKSIPYTVPGP